MILHTVLLKPVSGLCNMRCEYCFYCDEMKKRSQESYGMMSEETLKNIINKSLLQAEEEICFAFQGGEPTLRGLDFFRKAIEYERRFNKKDVKIFNVLQTNGLELSDDWCRFLKENQFLVGISIDGTPDIHDKYRHDILGNQTYDRIRQSVARLDRCGTEYNILTVVTKEAAENVREVYRSYKINGWRYQQYIACMEPFGEEWGKKRYSLPPKAYGRFLIELFKLWEKDLRRGKAPYIRQFENYIGILMGYPPEACEQSGVCSVQCVAEADGSAFPCDFYAMDEYQIGNYNENRIKDMMKNPNAEEFVKESMQYSNLCRECQWFVLCRGGCRRMRIQEGGSGLYRNYFCESYRMFFQECAEKMIDIAKYFKEKNGGF